MRFYFSHGYFYLSINKHTYVWNVGGKVFKICSSFCKNNVNFYTNSFKHSVCQVKPCANSVKNCYRIHACQELWNLDYSDSHQKLFKHKINYSSIIGFCFNSIKAFALGVYLECELYLLAVLVAMPKVIGVLLHPSFLIWYQETWKHLLLWLELKALPCSSFPLLRCVRICHRKVTGWEQDYVRVGIWSTG